MCDVGAGEGFEGGGYGVFEVVGYGVEGGEEAGFGDHAGGGGGDIEEGAAEDHGCVCGECGGVRAAAQEFGAAGARDVSDACMQTTRSRTEARER